VSGQAPAARVRAARVRAARIRTWGARVVVAGIAALALLGPSRRPGERLTLAPTVVTPLRTPPLVVSALPLRIAPPAADSAVSTDSARRLPALLPLYKRARAGERVSVEITAYCLQGITRAGNRVRPGIAAADRKFFPLGKYVDVHLGERRLGRFLIDDTGSAIKGPKLDLWTESCVDARRFGRRRGSATLVMRPVPDDSLEPPLTRLTR
jgi:3D (Asp-Asp-Asp) domain-containing protein